MIADFMPQENPISGDIIKNAICTLEASNLIFDQELVGYLERRSNVLDGKRSYWLQDIESEFAEGFGADTAKLIVERIKHIVDTNTTA